MRRFSTLLSLVAALTLSAPAVWAQAADVAAPGSLTAVVAPTGKPMPLGDAQSLALLYENGPLITAAGAGAGGANVSAIGSGYGSTTYGSSQNSAGGFYLADDFTVPAGGWSITDFTLYSYQTGSTTTTSTITGAFVQIWNGRPGDTGSTVVAGDLTTNRLTSSVWSGIYRTQQTDQATATTRPIFANTVTLATTLPAGTYWVQWGMTGSLASGPWTPPVSLPGTTAPVGNARQFATGAWADALDGTTTTQLAFPFIVNGTAGTPTGPVLTVNPTSIPFGTVTTGTTSTATTVTLTNNGSSLLTIASITGSGAPYTVNTTGTDLTLDPAQSTTFTVAFAPTATGAANGTVTITSDAPTSPNTIALTGTGAAPSTAVTYPSTDTPITITDNLPAGITSTITVPAGVGTISDVDIAFNATHSFTGDLAASVAHSGTSVTFLDRPGVPASTFGCGGDNPNFIADDDLPTLGALETSCGTTTAYTAGGHYTPNNPLTAFDGLTGAGTWTLTVSDNAASDTGSLTSWAVIISTLNTAGENGASATASRLTVQNPVTSQGQVNLTVATTQDVRVTLYDALGREVRVLFDRAMTAGQEAHIAFATQGLTSPEILRKKYKIL